MEPEVVDNTELTIVVTVVVIKCGIGIRTDHLLTTLDSLKVIIEEYILEDRIIITRISVYHLQPELVYIRFKTDVDRSNHTLLVVVHHHRITLEYVIDRDSIRVQDVNPEIITIVRHFI